MPYIHCKIHKDGSYQTFAFNEGDLLSERSLFPPMGFIFDYDADRDAFAEDASAVENIQATTEFIRKSIEKLGVEQVCLIYRKFLDRFLEDFGDGDMSTRVFLEKYPFCSSLDDRDVEDFREEDFSKFQQHLNSNISAFHVLAECSDVVEKPLLEAIEGKMTEVLDLINPPDQRVVLMGHGLVAVPTNWQKKHLKYYSVWNDHDNGTATYTNKHGLQVKLDTTGRWFGAHTKTTYDLDGNVIASKRVAKSGKTIIGGSYTDAEKLKKLSILAQEYALHPEARDTIWPIVSGTKFSKFYDVVGSQDRFENYADIELLCQFLKKGDVTHEPQREAINVNSNVVHLLNALEWIAYESNAPQSVKNKARKSFETLHDNDQLQGKIESLRKIGQNPADVICGFALAHDNIESIHQQRGTTIGTGVTSSIHDRGPESVRIRSRN